MIYPKLGSTKLIYLCDWRHCIVHEKQITNIEWVYDNFEPLVWDVMDVVDANPQLFAKTGTTTAMGNPKLVISMASKDYIPELDPSEKETTNFVIRATQIFLWTPLLNWSIPPFQC